MIAIKDNVLPFVAGGIGLAVSMGYPAGIVASTAMPIVCLMPKTRRLAFSAAFGYYVAALRPIVPAFERYIGESYLALFALWASASILLSLPWIIVWTPHSIGNVWRVPLALIATAIPPLGIIGLGSPLVAAGYLFPGTAWIGLAAIVIFPEIFLSAKSVSSRVIIVSLVGALCVGSHLFERRHIDPPDGWVAIDTHLGDLSKPFRDFAAAEFIQQQARESTAHVLIFPEAVVPRWSEATQMFWHRTLAECRRRGQILAIGAGIPEKPPQNDHEKWNALRSYDFQATLRTLKGENPPRFHTNAPLPQEQTDNAMVLVGAQSATFYQRIPVPIGMWQPFRRTGVPLRLIGPGVLRIDHQRAAILICYEQMLPFPILASMLQHPTVIVGISNTFWVSGTGIPRYQANAVRGWAKLFGLPYLLAINS